MTFEHTNRPGFLLGFVDFFTAGLFFLLYMPLGGLQDELEYILGHKLTPYWKAYLLGIQTLFIYPLVWMARIAEELIRYNKLRKFQNRRIENSPQNKGQGQRHLVE